MSRAVDRWVRRCFWRRYGPYVVTAAAVLLAALMLVWAMRLSR